MGATTTHDAHRHLGTLPAYAFYGGPPIQADTTARATVEELIADLDREGVERALVLPNYGVLDAIFGAAREHDLVVHVHTSPGAASDIDEIGQLVERYGDDVAIHLVHLGGGMSGHMKLLGGRFFDWIAAGKRVYTDTSWAIGFAPRWLAREIDRRGVGADRVLFASDEPWGDHAGESARLAAAFGDGDLFRMATRENFEKLYG